MNIGVYLIDGRHCACIANGVRKGRSFFGVFETVRLMMMAGMCLLFAIGCGPLTTPSDGGKPGPSVVDKLDSSAVFNALADAVEHKTCKTAKKLGRLVEVLQRNNSIDADAVKSFDGAFDVSKDRDLTSEDAARLRGLK